MPEGYHISCVGAPLDGPLRDAPQDCVASGSGYPDGRQWPELLTSLLCSLNAQRPGHLARKHWGTCPYLSACGGGYRDFVEDFFRWIRRSAWHLLGERGIRSGKMIPARAERAMNGDENGCEGGDDIGGGVQNGAVERASPCISITSRAAGDHRSLVTSPTPNPPCAP